MSDFEKWVIIILSFGSLVMVFLYGVWATYKDEKEGKGPKEEEYPDNHFGM